MTARAVPCDPVAEAVPLPQSDHYAWTRAWLAETTLSPIDQSNREASRLNKATPWKVGSFDSQDSTASFRIPADHEGPLPCDRVRKAQLAVAMEQCTGMMKGLLLPPEQRPKMKEPLCALTPEVASVAASIAGVVCSEMQNAPVEAIQERLVQNRKTTMLRKHQLTTLTEQLRHPLIAQLEGDLQELRRQLKNNSSDIVALKRRVEEERQERHRLISVREEIETRAQSLRDVGAKYDAVVEENRVLRGTIRELRGDVQVMLRLPYKAGSYVEATNRDEVTLTGKKKSRSVPVDGLISGDIKDATIRRCLSPLLTSTVDGIDAMLVGLSIGEASSFVSVVARTIDGLVTMVEEQEMKVEIEVQCLTVHGSLTVLSKMDFTEALSSYLGGRKPRHQAILNFLTQAVEQRTGRSIEHSGHLVVRVHVLHMDKETGSNVPWSTLTLLQLQSRSKEGWWNDPDVVSVLSALTEISAKSVPQPTSPTSSVVKELLKKNGKSKLYWLLLELANASGYQKEDAMALKIGSDIRSARVDGETKARQQTARFLKKKIVASNKQIAVLAEEKIKISSEKETLLTDVDDLKSQIAALEEIKHNRQIRRNQGSAMHAVKSNGDVPHCRSMNCALQGKSSKQMRKNGCCYGIRRSRNLLTAKPSTNDFAFGGAVRDHTRRAKKAQ